MNRARRQAACWLFLAVFAASAQTPTDWLNRGIAAFKTAQYEEAASAFQKAIDLNPNDVAAHLYLATVHMQQWIPGANSPQNIARAQAAENEFRRTLDLDPGISVALASLASLSFNTALSEADPQEKARKLDEARQWCQRQVSVDPHDKQPHYMLAVIGWQQFYPALITARGRLGMKPPDPGPLPNADARQDLKNKYWSVIEDALSNLREAIEIDPDYDDAMAYMNLLVRERGDLRDTREEYLRDIAEADGWTQKALAVKQRKSGGTLPPAPQAPVTAPASSRFRRTGPVQVGNLIVKVEPVYPDLAKQAGIQGDVHFAAVISKDGKVTNLQLIAGHPLLVRAATDAVRQWVYKPSILNGAPIDLITEVVVNFSLPAH